MKKRELLLRYDGSLVDEAHAYYYLATGERIGTTELLHKGLESLIQQHKKPNLVKMVKQILGDK